MSRPARLMALCTVEAGVDALAQVLRRRGPQVHLVGLHPSAADGERVSGWVDVGDFARRHGVTYSYVHRYDLRGDQDRRTLQEAACDLVWVAGWQRLVPEWLIAAAPLGGLGAHGSPDGIVRGRGRSPQNWALMLGCASFEISLFRLTPAADDGPVVATRTFRYGEADDISVSYRKSSHAVADMLVEVLGDPALLERAVPQSGEPGYFPQRRPEDGVVDWALGCREIWAHCRALAHPYPGLRTSHGDASIALWDLLPFDDVVGGEPGEIVECFDDNNFLVQAGDGRVLVRKWSAAGWHPEMGQCLSGRNYLETLNAICARHREKHPDQPINWRILERIAAFR